MDLLFLFFLVDLLLCFLLAVCFGLPLIEADLPLDVFTLCFVEAGLLIGPFPLCFVEADLLLELRSLDWASLGATLGLSTRRVGDGEVTFMLPVLLMDWLGVVLVSSAESVECERLLLRLLLLVTR